MPTQAQLIVLRNDIAADAQFNDVPHDSTGAAVVVAVYNLAAVPSFWVYKTLVSLREIGDSINGTELAGLTTANNERLQTVALFSSDGVNPALPDRRAFFNDIFSGAGGTQTRANLDVLWRRLASRYERLFTIGTGSTAAPGTAVLQGPLTVGTVLDAWSA